MHAIESAADWLAARESPRRRRALASYPRRHTTAIFQHSLLHDDSLRDYRRMAASFGHARLNTLTARLIDLRAATISFISLRLHVIGEFATTRCLPMPMIY
jgi:hypothetical protein